MHVRTMGLWLGLAGCGAAEDAAPNDGGSSSNGGSSSSSSSSGAPAVLDASAPGPRTMVRIGHVVRPDFLVLDACFGTTHDGVTTWAGPVWRDDWSHGASYARITTYQRIAPGPTTVRFVAHQSNDCTTTIAGLGDLPLDVPLVPAGDHDAWFTIMAHGDAAQAGSFAIQTLVDRETLQDTPYALRLVTLDPAQSPIELGSVPNPDYSGYDRRIDGASYGAPSPYTSWTPSFGTPLYFGFKIFRQGQSAGEPLLTGDRAQSDATAKGSWSMFLIPGHKDGDADSWTMCSDGAEGPRLCYPCGTPGCEGK